MASKQYKAQLAAREAIKNGELYRPDACELCGSQPIYTRAGIVAHHWRGYDYPLDVWFICVRCSAVLRDPEFHNGTITREQAIKLIKETEATRPEQGEFGLWLAQFLQDKGWSYRELARRMGMSQTAVSNAISGSPGWDFCAQLAEVIDEPPITLFKFAGLLPANEPDKAALNELTEIFNQLDETNRALVLWFARGRYQEQ